MQLRPRLLRGCGQSGQGGDDAAVAALDEKTLRRVPPPSIGMGQQVNELRRGEPSTPSSRDVSRCGLVHDPVDTAKARRFLEFVADDVIAEVLGDVRPLLDDAAIHIDDVERAVRRVGDPDRAEALVGGREKLSTLIRLADAQP